MLSIPKNIKYKIFIIDASGALFSAFMLGVVLVNFNEYIGLPVKILNLLAFFPVLFFLIDIYFTINYQKNNKLFLKIIGSLNLFYCFLSLIILINYFETIKIIGLIYFILEIIIVASIALLEFKIMKKEL